MLNEEELTGKIIKAFYNVYNTLGYGFLEKVYQNALMLELAKNGLMAKPKQAIYVYYNSEIVGEFEADLMIENKIIVELKAVEMLHTSHEAQLLNYLRATKIEIGLLFNFGKEAQFKRKFFSNINKQTTDKPDNAKSDLIAKLLS